MSSTRKLWVTLTAVFLILGLASCSSNGKKSFDLAPYGIPITVDAPESCTLIDEYEAPDDAKTPKYYHCLLYTSPSPRDGATSRMPSSA